MSDNNVIGLVTKDKEPEETVPTYRVVLKGYAGEPGTESEFVLTGRAGFAGPQMVFTDVDGLVIAVFNAEDVRSILLVPNDETA